MIRNSPISRTEHVFLVTVTTFLALVVIGGVVVDVYASYQHWYPAPGTIRFSGNPPFTTPIFHLISVFILLTVVKHRFFGTAILSTVYLLAMLISLCSRYNTFNPEFTRNAPLSELLMIIVYPIDLLAFVFIVSFGIWYTSFLLRFGWNPSSRLLL
jgi:hypothetical protein